jgi:hypothetical protein
VEVKICSQRINNRNAGDHFCFFNHLLYSFVGAASHKANQNTNKGVKLPSLPSHRSQRREEPGGLEKLTFDDG